MALDIGDITATSGMTQAIYNQIQANIEPDLGDLEEDKLEPIREGWRKLAHGIATGVVTHIQSNLEMRDSDTNDIAERAVTGDTGEDPGGGDHHHDAGDLVVTLDDLVFR